MREGRFGGREFATALGERTEHRVEVRVIRRDVAHHVRPDLAPPLITRRLIGDPLGVVLRPDGHRQPIVVVHLRRIQTQTVRVLGGGEHDSPLVVHNLGGNPCILQSRCQHAQVRVIGQLRGLNHEPTVRECNPRLPPIA